MKKTFVLITMITAFAFLLSACAPQEAESAAEPLPVFENTLIAEGRLVPASLMDQTALVSGKIAEVLVQEGEQVAADQPLVRLQDAPEAQLALVRAEQEQLAAQQAITEMQTAADLALARARVDVLNARQQVEDALEEADSDDSEENLAALGLAEANLAHLEDLLETLENGDGIDPDRMAAAQARLKAAEAALLSAQSALDALVLKASTTGSVVGLDLQPGQWISAAAPLFTLADLTDWVIETENLTELEVVDVSLGQQVEIVFDALPEQTFRGEVAAIETRFEEKRGDITYTATIQLDQADPALRWGMTAAIQFLP